MDQRNPKRGRKVGITAFYFLPPLAPSVTYGQIVVCVCLMYRLYRERGGKRLYIVLAKEIHKETEKLRKEGLVLPRLHVHNSLEKSTCVKKYMIS